MSEALKAEHVKYDVISSSELPHYMTLDEMHQRLVSNIRSKFAK